MNQRKLFDLPRSARAEELREAGNWPLSIQEGERQRSA
jgi:hypothetical protein